MTRITDQTESIQLEVNALLQQLIASRGDPSVKQTLTERAQDIWQRIFQLYEQEGDAQVENLDNAREALRKYFPDALEEKKESWQDI